MTNNQMLKKMSQDMLMRNFSPYTYDFYIRKTREMIKYFNKPFEEVTIEGKRSTKMRIENLMLNLLYRSCMRFSIRIFVDRLLIN